MDNQAWYLDEVLQIDYGATLFARKVLQLTSVMSPIETLKAAKTFPRIRLRFVITCA